MEARIARKQTTLRLGADLMDRLREEARREHRSLNSLIEAILARAMEHRPNADTLAAIEEARSGKELETLDLDHFEEFVASL